MDIGFGAPVSGAWATPRNLTELGRRAERLGYRSLWTFQRLLAPSSAVNTSGTMRPPLMRNTLREARSAGHT